MPNVITLPGIVVGIAASFVPGWPVGTLDALLSAAAGYAVLALFGIAYEKLRGVEGLGQGDWKMVAMLGAFLGWRSAVLSLLLASVAGTIVGIAFFGLHPVHTFVIGSGSSVVSGASVATLPIGSALGRLLLATAYTLFSMLSVVGVATLVGVATENALAAMSAGIGLYIVSAILDALPGLSRIHPLLPVHYLEAWTPLFVPGGSLEGMGRGAISAAIWGVVPLVLAFRLFQRKDVLC